MAVTDSVLATGNGAGPDPSARRRRRRRALIFSALAIAADASAVWRRGYGVGGNVIVRCRDGHVYRSIWLPAASVKSLRLGWWRIQWCPVGRHWSLVTPVRQSTLTEAEQTEAREYQDVRVP